MGSWFESDEFWESFRPIMFNRNRIAQSADEIEAAPNWNRRSGARGSPR